MSEITLSLHPCTTRKLHEEMISYNLSYDQVLERLFEHEQFLRLSEQLAAVGANSNMYFPGAAIAVAITIDTQFSTQSPLCHQLLTSFAIALCYEPSLWTLLLQSDIESAMHSSGLEFRLTRRTSGYQQTMPA